METFVSGPCTSVSVTPPLLGAAEFVFGGPGGLLFRFCAHFCLNRGHWLRRWSKPPHFQQASELPGWKASTLTSSGYTAATVFRERLWSWDGGALAEYQHLPWCVFPQVSHNWGVILASCRVEGSGNMGACVCFRAVNSRLMSFAAERMSGNVFTPRMTMPCCIHGSNPFLNHSHIYSSSGRWLSLSVNCLNLS